MYTNDPLLLSESEDYIMTLLANGWVAVRTVRDKFSINNGEPQDMAIIDRRGELGLVAQSSERAYVATVCPLGGHRLWLSK